MVDLNLTSTYLVFRAVVRRLGDEGRLIAFTSEQGADGGVGGQSAYSAAKAGVARLVESTAEETPSPITAHAVAPSFIRFDADAETSGVEPEQIVEACRFLLGESGRAFDGQILRAYGPVG
jgi:3-oxoacyl-[acyl-carrier protein] reductase